ncbi:YczE/YyaS/YitT family protein [Streptococcus pluranimalium]|uniref:YczE/YyaS/YitT family protein n=1 Tax=Streptococcus pluranimalium TaxID=82348 RepID=UPI0039FC5025
MSHRVNRLNQILFYLIGGFLIGLGITLCTKASLGVSPVVSLAYNISVIFKIPIGITSFANFVLCIFIQFLLLRKDFERFRILQVVASFLTSFVMQIFDELLVTPETLTLRFTWLFAGIVVMGCGASLTVAMRFIPNPADALAHTVGQVTGKGFGTGKNLIDIVFISSSLLLSFTAGKGWLGVGIGTLIASLGTGRVIAVFFPIFEKLYETHVEKA